MLVTGAQGNLGLNLMPVFSAVTGVQVVGLDRGRLDLSSSAKAIRTVLDEHQPAVIINAAAYTNVDKAESESELAYQVNEQGPATLAHWCSDHEAYLIHISTDYVFDGMKGTPYTPKDVPNPINVYGASKLAGEQRVQEILPKHSAVVRTSWLYGPGQKGFLWFVAQSAQQQKTIGVVDDQWGTPTWTGHLCEMIVTMLQDRPSGLFHGCNSGLTTRFEQAVLFCELMGMDTTAIEQFMEPKPTSAFTFPAKRPMNTAMVPSTLSGKLAMPSWQDGMTGFMAQHWPQWQVQLNPLKAEV